LLTFTPAANQSGTGYDSFEFAVVDNNGGVDETPQTMTIDVTPAADAPLVTVIPDLTPEIVQDYQNETFTSYDPVINSGRSTGVLEFDGYARSVSMSIKSFDGRPNNDTGIVELIKDGEVIKTYSLNDYFTGNPSESAGKILTFSSDIYFNEVRVSNTSTNDQFKVENVALVSPFLVTYSVEASAELTDAGETLSNLILKVPSSLGGVLVVDGFAPSAVLSADGAYNYYSVSPENGGVELIFDFADEPSEAELDVIESAIDSIEGIATSWEAGDGFALAATSGDDVIVGTSNGDEIAGEEGDDVIFGGAGADILSGGDGNDTLAGEGGNDTLTGGDGNDYIDGGAGADALYGGAGNDTIAYDILDTEIDGGLGIDTLIVSSGTVNLSNVSNIEVIQLGSGATVIGSDTVSGIDANDVINATDDANTLIIQSVEEGTNTININTDSLPFTGSVGGYEIYTDGFVILQVEDDIIVD
ncbi:MAG: hypothetical protein PHX44_09610, partial [Sulfurimonas sp.]|nr:hypothetical protein [Sulfurimonas sp.]MDD3451242.1 hypothetical protein [Sulfurimonas sp.]